MNLEYQLIKQDYIDYNINHMNTSPMLKRSLLVQRYVPPIIYLICPILLAGLGDIPLWYWYICFTIGAVLWIIFYPKYFKRKFSKKLSRLLDEGKRKDTVGNHSMTLTDDGIVDKTEYGESKIKYIERVVETDQHIFIYISAVSAFIIPLRYFHDIVEKNRFLLLLDQYK